MSELSVQVGSSLSALTHEFNVITNNMANVSTAGFKRRTNAFSKILEEKRGGSDPGDPGGIDINTAHDFTQGNPVYTGSPLDFMISGKGFFAIETPEGPRYTRNGIFDLNVNRQIVNTDGNIVLGEGGPITVPLDVQLSELSVSADGIISVGETNVGKLRVVGFGENEQLLIPSGSTSFQTPEGVAAGTPENIIVRNKHHEGSNVQIVEELTDMIMVQRLYEANMKFITSTKETSDALMGVAMG